MTVRWRRWLPFWGFVAVAAAYWGVGGYIAASSRPNASAAAWRAQDSTYVAQIKSCCAKQGWVWADNPRLHEIARNVYGGNP